MILMIVHVIVISITILPEGAQIILLCVSLNMKMHQNVDLVTNVEVCCSLTDAAIFMLTWIFYPCTDSMEPSRASETGGKMAGQGDGTDGGKEFQAGGGPKLGSGQEHTSDRREIRINGRAKILTLKNRTCQGRGNGSKIGNKFLVIGNSIRGICSKNATFFRIN